MAIGTPPVAHEQTAEQAPAGPPRNPPVSEATRTEFAKDGVTQGPDGIFYRHSKPLLQPDGTPMKEDEVRAMLAREKAGGTVPPKTPADDGNKSPTEAAKVNPIKDQEAPRP